MRLSWAFAYPEQATAMAMGTTIDGNRMSLLVLPHGSPGRVAGDALRMAVVASRAHVSIAAHVLVVPVGVGLVVRMAIDAFEDAVVAGARVAITAARPDAAMPPRVDRAEL